MNERIKELIGRCTTKSTSYFDGRGNVTETYFNKEKFAELIVRECTQLLFAESERLYAYSSECDNMRYSEDAEVCAEKCMDNILMIEKHFGVEQ